jgi:hypothetical protein
MTTPTDHQIRQLLQPLHDLRKTDTPNGPTRLDHLEQRILHACHRNRTGTTHERDGYPTGRGPGDGGEDTPQSSTEAAALSNLHGATRDPVNELVENIHAHLLEAVNHLGALRTLLTQLDKISDPRRTTNPAASCQACDRTVECTSADPIRAGYCSECSTAWYRWKKTETAAGRQPDRPRFERWRRQQLAA